MSRKQAPGFDTVAVEAPATLAPAPLAAPPARDRGLPQLIGNRAFLAALGIQPKLRVAPAGDRYEQEADRAADAVMRGLEPSIEPGGDAALQRKCCAECENCADEEEETVRRAPRDQAEAPAAEEQPAETPAVEGQAAPPGWLAEDDTALGPGQMHRSEFMQALRAAVCETADEGLAPAGHTSQGCPWIQFWLAFYENKPAAHIERAIRRYAPEAAGVREGASLIPVVAARVRISVDRYTKTGEVTGLPEDMPAMGPTVPEIAFKSREGGARLPAGPAALRRQLGSGEPLPGTIRSRMESAFGTSFGHVRVHAGRDAAELSDRLNARAFTIGNHVAFGAGEFTPETTMGQALLAHELAHVVQQSGTRLAPGGVHDGRSDPLEQEADEAAARATLAPSPGARGFKARASAALHSGLRLQRCTPKTPEKPESMLDDPAFRKVWEQKFQEGVALLNDSIARKGKQKGCAFPGEKKASEWKYDDQNWRFEFRGEEMRRYHAAWVPTKDPHVSVDELFKHLERWECDCALFAELTWLYAWRYSLSPDAFDKKFAGMRLRQQETTGMARESYNAENIELGLQSGNFDQMWDNAPVGTKVIWINDSNAVPENAAWKHENAVKTFKGDGKKPDLYTAHPVGKEKTEDEVKMGVAESAADFPGKSFEVTDDTIAKLTTSNAPEQFLTDLATLKGRVFPDKSSFSQALTAPAQSLAGLRSNEPGRYQQLMADVFTYSRSGASPQEKADYVKKNIRRFEFHVPK